MLTGAFEERLRRGVAHPDDDGEREQLKDDDAAEEIGTDPRHHQRRPHQHERTGDWDHRGQRQPRGLYENRLQPLGPLRRVMVDHRWEQHVVQLVRQPLRPFGEPLPH